MTTVSNIMKSLPGGSPANVTKFMSDFKGNSAQLHQGNKYSSRAKLDGAGVGKMHDELQNSLVYNEKLMTACTFASNKLQAQKMKLEELNEIVVKFRSNNIIEGQEQEVAEEALGNIEKILNTKVNGEYIFGGKNSFRKPVSGLTKLTNIVNNRSTTNYTEVTSVEINFPISENKKVNLGLIAADNLGIAGIIASINSYKSSNGNNKAQIDKFLDEGLNHFEKLQLKVEEAIDATQQAKQYNDKSKVNTTLQVERISAADAIELANATKDSIQSLFTTYKLAEVQNSISEKLFSR